MNNHSLIHWNFFYLLGEEYAFSLRHGLRFDDISPTFSFGLIIKIYFELVIVQRQIPSEGEEIILIWSLLTHFHEIFCQIILSGKVMHARKVINFLMVFHLQESLWEHMPVCPPDIPLCEIGIFFYFEFELL